MAKDQLTTVRNAMARMAAEDRKADAAVNAQRAADLAHIHKVDQLMTANGPHPRGEYQDQPIDVENRNHSPQV